jgi:hypothetical protein
MLIFLLPVLLPGAALPGLGLGAWAGFRLYSKMRHKIQPEDQNRRTEV